MKLIPEKRLELFPLTARVVQDSLTIAGFNLSALANQFGTPLYIYDRTTMDAAVTDYLSALLREYPAPAALTYAGKAFLNTAIAQWACLHDLYVDCTGEGELAMAIAGGVARERILVHGVNKSPADLQAAIRHAGTLVVDHPAELEQIATISAASDVQDLPDLWLRLLPGVAVQTHHSHTQTGQHDSKFGMTPAELLQAAQFCQQNGLPLTGIHFHQGSNFRDPAPLREAISLGLDLAAQIGLPQDWHFSPGGGWGVAYHEDELPQPRAQDYVHLIARDITTGCRARAIPLPHLHLEPGRSLVARAGVALYRVGALKHRGERTWVLVDGGMSDNPRFALYNARYSCLPVTAPLAPPTQGVSVAGSYCESGDILIQDLNLPQLQPNDLLAIPAAGAYQLSMASNYNGARKPAVLLVQPGAARLIQRRETIEDLLRRDLAL